MTNAELTQKAKSLKSQMLTRRKDAKGTLSDLKILLQCKANKDYTKMFETKLYTIHGGEYCEYLQLLS